MDLSTIKPSAEQTHLSKTFQPGVWHLVATLIVLFLWMRLVFWGGWGIGLSLALLFSEGLLFLANRGVRHQIFTAGEHDGGQSINGVRHQYRRCVS